MINNLQLKIGKLFLLLAAICLLGSARALPAFGQEASSVELARIKYRGGGDWYNDPSALKNLIDFVQQQVPISINPNYTDVPLGSPDLLQFPFAFMTGHGTIQINDAEARNLRTYLDNGGFLYVDDDYGLDDNFRRLISQTFPDEQLIELPFNHPIYHQVFDFDAGLPKIHEHDNKPPQGFGLFRNGRMVIFYSYESNLADGWANPEVHKDPAVLRQKALQMGTNILVYALTNGGQKL